MGALSRFSLTDFLVYLFPGIVTGVGVYVLVLGTPLNRLFVTFKVDLWSGLVLLAAAYVLGVLVSGLSGPLAERLQQLLALGDPRREIFPQGCDEQVGLAVTSTYGPATVDGESRFYLCRTMVREHMPVTAREIQRQNDLMRFRQDLVGAAVVWLCTGLTWSSHAAQAFSRTAGVAAALVCVGTTTALLVSLARRTHRNRVREVREVYAAFLAGHATGRFAKRGPGGTSNERRYGK